MALVATGRYDPPPALSIRFQSVAAGGTGSERTRIQLCGRLSVEVEGVSLTEGLRGKQVPLLFAYLALNRDRHVGRDELIDALWPAKSPQSEDAALRTLLSRLRSALGASGLTGRDELSLTLPLPVWIDFEAAGTEVERALHALERGDARGAWALAQVPMNIASRGLLPGSNALWLEPRRRELEEIRLETLEVIGRAGLSLGGRQLASAQRTARNLIETEPYRESGYVLLMEALAAQGNVAAGLLVFDRLRKLLREDLGTSPSPDALAAHERLLHPERRQAPGAGAGSEGAGSPIELPPELRTRGAPQLVGRKRELEALRGTWAQVRAAASAESGGGRGIVLLAGDPGIGKTRLLAELARSAHESGAVVLAGRSPAETLVPYQPFIEALRPYLLSVAISELRASTREYGSELSRLVPELRRRLPGLPPPVTGEPETERYRLFEAVVGLLAEIAGSTPLLLVLDDLHWADRPSLLLLRHLARAAGTGRFLIVGAYRVNEASAGTFAGALSELRGERLVSQLDLAGLGEGETAELIALRTGAAPSPEFARALHGETEGNPFFIEEILRHLAEAGIDPVRSGPGELERAGLPEGVKEVISRRLERLDARVIEWLRIAAVLGRDFDVALLERVAALDEEEFLRALEDSLAAGLIIELPGSQSAGRYGFSHALVRETLYEGMSAPRRARLHRRVGESLEATSEGRQLTALALHFARAGGPQDFEKAIRYALAAGRQATAMLAHEEAAGHYARALEALDCFDPTAANRRCELLLLLGEARVRAGEQPEVDEALREAAALARRLQDGGLLARAAIGSSGRYIQQSGVVDEELIAMLKEALEMGAGERTTVRVLLLARLCGALYYSSEREQMKLLSAEATALATELGDLEARAVAAGARRRAYWEPGHLEERLSSSTELLTLAREAGNVELSLQGHAWLVVDLLESGDRDAVEAQVEAFTAGAQELRQPLYLWHSLVWRATLTLLDGRLAEAESFAAEALAAGGHAESVTSAQYYAAQLMSIRQEQGRMQELEPAAGEFVRAFPTVPAWRAGLAWLLFETGQVEEARRELDLIAARRFDDIPQDGNWMVAITVLGELCAALGDADRAARLYRLLLPYRDANVVIGFGALCQGCAARSLGVLASCVGLREAARDHFERALTRNASLRAPVCLARTQLDYAASLAGGARAAELIDAAARTARELDLPSIARRARELGES